MTAVRRRASWRQGAAGGSGVQRADGVKADGLGVSTESPTRCGHKKGRDTENGNLLSTLLCFKLKQTGELKEKKISIHAWPSISLGRRAHEHSLRNSLQAPFSLLNIYRYGVWASVCTLVLDSHKVRGDQ